MREIFAHLYCSKHEFQPENLQRYFSAYVHYALTANELYLTDPSPLASCHILCMCVCAWMFYWTICDVRKAQECVLIKCVRGQCIYLHIWSVCGCVFVCMRVREKEKVRMCIIPCAFVQIYSPPFTRLTIHWIVSLRECVCVYPVSIIALHVTVIAELSAARKNSRWIQRGWIQHWCTENGTERGCEWLRRVVFFTKH